MAMLSVKNLSKRFGTSTILDGLSFEVEANTIHGFVGQNGAGKTTTMKLILGLLASDAGEIAVNGHKVTYGENQTNQYIGYLPDVPEFYGYMNAVEYLTLCAKITNIPHSDRTTRIAELLELVGLHGVKKRISGYSRGMKQRLGIAQALLNKPKLLICDEPTSALDPIGRKEILEILNRVKSETTVIFSTHILSDVERICDTVGFLHNGKIVLQGSIDDVRNVRPSDGFEIEFRTPLLCEQFIKQYGAGTQVSPTHLVYLEKNETDFMQAMQMCVSHQLTPQRLEMREVTLENLFLEVTKS